MCAWRAHGMHAAATPRHAVCEGALWHAVGQRVRDGRPGYMRAAALLTDHRPRNNNRGQQVDPGGLCTMWGRLSRPSGV